MKQETLPIVPTLRDMKIGEMVTFPLCRLNSVKNTCSNVSLLYKRKYTTKISRPDDIVKVFRIK